MSRLFRWARRWGLGGPLLLLALVACYAPVLGFEFVELDDLTSVANNHHLDGGLTLANLQWALTSTYFGWWHPTTWASHLLDVSLYGRWAGGHHLTSALLHLVNAALTVAALRGFGFSRLRSLGVAMLFALHPTRVESVAWVSERKDVLSVCFFLLTVLAWQRYRRAPSLGRWGVTALAFALGLGAKSMLVTVPVGLLLLDVWRGVPWEPRRRALDVGPLLLLSLLAGLATLYTQHQKGAMQSTAQLPVLERLATVPLAWLKYLELTFWPAQLCAYYPRFAPTVEQTALGVGGVLLLVLALWRLRPRARPVSFGLGWAALVLLPVIGLVQVGGQFVAERYLSLPHLGLFAGLGVLVPARALARRRRFARGLMVATGAVLALVTALQVRTWRDSETLLRATLAVQGSPFIQSSLGLMLLKQGRTDEALVELKQAAPDYPFGQALYGLALEASGDDQGALAQLSAALQRTPDDAEVRRFYKQVLVRAGLRAAQGGRFAQAQTWLNQALALDPADAEVGRLAAAAAEDARRGSVGDGVRR